MFVHIPAQGASFLAEIFSPTGILTILKLVVIFLFIAVFWALFDQTGSSWVLQAEDLDRNWMGIEWLPSQIQAINPVMIVTLVPLFSYVIYPMVAKAIKTPGTPKAQCGPYHSKSQGVSKVDAAAPTLIEI